MGAISAIDASRQNAATAAGDPQSEMVHIRQLDAASPLSLRTQAPIESSLFPRGQHDWNSVAPIIYGLYIVENIPLPMVIEIMKSNHNFKATTRMYKSRFAKWGWTKNAKTKPKPQAVVKSSQRLNQQRKNESAVTQFILSPTSRMLAHQGTYALHLDASCRAFKGFILHWAETDPRWKTGSLDSSLKVHPLPDYIDSAVCHFEGGDFTQGGKFMRLAFLEIENCIKDDHLLNIAGVLLEYGLPFTRSLGMKGEDIFMAFSKYVYQQALIHWGSHPITLMARGLVEAASGGTDQAHSWIKSMFRLRIDLFKSLRGDDDDMTLMTQAIFLSTHSDYDLALDYNKHALTRAERISKQFDRNHMNVLRTQMAAARIKLVYNIIDDELGLMLQQLCAIARARYKNSQDHDPDPWVALKQQTLFRGSHYLLSMYWAKQGDTEMMIQAGREAIYLDSDPTSPWRSFVVMVIDIFKEHGAHEEVDRINSWKKDVELPQSLEKLLEEE